MKLHYQTYFDKAPIAAVELPPVLIVPGLFGSIGNWRGFAKKLSEHRRVIVVDQRNHGLSPHASTHSYFDLVGDIVELLDDLEIEIVSLCGHSMGGKAAMVFALIAPERLDRLMVLDIAPVIYQHSHKAILEGLARVDLIGCKSRSEVERQLVGAIPDKSTRLFIMLSLAGKSNEFYWRLNVPVLLESLPLIGGFPLDELSHRQHLSKTVFIKGSCSNYVDSEYYDSIMKFFPGADIKSVNGAGHWLHVEQPDAVIDLCLNFLEEE